MDNAVTIELEYDQVQSIVRNTLLQDYNGLCDEIEMLQAKFELMPHEKEDLKNNLKYRKGIKRAIKYYSVPGTMDAYFKAMEG
jgi:predicted enzyme involved in methoxymalonyl-ACP biosynthesis